MGGFLIIFIVYCKRRQGCFYSNDRELSFCEKDQGFLPTFRQLVDGNGWVIKCRGFGGVGSDFYRCNDYLFCKGQRDTDSKVCGAE